MVVEETQQRSNFGCGTVTMPSAADDGVGLLDALAENETMSVGKAACVVAAPQGQVVSRGDDNQFLGLFHPPGIGTNPDRTAIVS